MIPFSAMYTPCEKPCEKEKHRFYNLQNTDYLIGASIIKAFVNFPRKSEEECV